MQNHLVITLGFLQVLRMISPIRTGDTGKAAYVDEFQQAIDQSSDLDVRGFKLKTWFHCKSKDGSRDKGSHTESRFKGWVKRKLRGKNDPSTWVPMYGPPPGLKEANELYPMKSDPANSIEALKKMKKDAKRRDKQAYGPHPMPPMQ